MEERLGQLVLLNGEMQQLQSCCEFSSWAKKPLSSLLMKR